MIQQWDFPVDEPVSLPAWRCHRLTAHLPAIAGRVAQGEALRTIANEYGMSHDALRQQLMRGGHATRQPLAAAVPARRTRANRRLGRGCSSVLSREEVAALLVRQQAGESIRALARTSGVSHETVRRVLARNADTPVQVSARSQMVVPIGIGASVPKPTSVGGTGSW